MVVAPGRSGNGTTNTSRLPTLPPDTIQPDLTLLPRPVSNDLAADVIAVRAASRNEPYTRIGPRMLVGMVRHHDVMTTNRNEELANESSKAYAARFRGTSYDDANDEPVLPIHLFDVVGSAFLNLLRTGADQSILLCGTSTPTHHRMITKHLCDLSKSSHKKSKTQSAILRAEQVLSAFGNARDAQGREEQLYDRVTEFQFDGNGRVVGAKFLTYLLDSSRLTDAPNGAYNFNILSTFLSSLTTEERQVLLLPPDIATSCVFINSSVSKSTEVMTLPDLFENFNHLKITKIQQGAVMKLLSGILHLGRIHFFDDSQTGRAKPKSFDVIDEAAEILEVSPEKLLAALTNRTTRVGHDTFSIELDSTHAMEQTAAVARAMYLTLFEFVVDKCNACLCRAEQDWNAFISVVDIPARLDGGMSLHGLLGNMAAERVWEFAEHKLAVDVINSLRSEGYNITEDAKSSNESVLNTLGIPDGSGLLSIINSQINQPMSSDGTMINKVVNSSSVVPSKTNLKSFVVSHSHGNVEYDMTDWRHHVESSSRELIGIFSSDGTLGSTFLQYVAGGSGSMQPTALSSISLIRSHSVSQPVRRQPSTTVRRQNTATTRVPKDTVMTRLSNDLDVLLSALQSTSTWVVLCMASSAAFAQSRFDIEYIRAQAAGYGLGTLTSLPSSNYFTDYPIDDFIKRYNKIHASLSDPAIEATRENVVKFIESRESWNQDDVFIGRSRIFLSDIAWQELEADLSEANRNAGITNPDGMMSSVALSEYGGAMSEYGGDDYDSKVRPGDVEPSPVALNMLPVLNAENAAQDVSTKKVVRVEKEVRSSHSRRAWLCLAFSLTCCVPSVFLSVCGRMKRRDIQIAWREKVAIFLIILFICACMLFYIIGLGMIICPRQNILSEGEVNGRNTVNNPYVAMYGKYYRISDVIKTHVNTNQWISGVAMEQTVLGRDVSAMFQPTDHWSTICPNISQPSGWDNIVRDIPIAFQRVWYIHSIATQGKDLLDYFNALKPSMKGDLARDQSWISSRLGEDTVNKYVIVAYDKVYDVSQYFAPTNTNNFLGSNMQAIFSTFGKAGVDVTQYIEQIKKVENPQAWASYMKCMDGLFYQGVVDHRLDARCIVSNYILLGSSVLLVAVIGFKFVAALQCGSRRDPTKYDKFVLINIPCYTEGADSLTRTLEALAQTTYDDKRKLLFIVADGMVCGSGNDRPTPRIVLDILGVSPDVDPEPKEYVALGDGSRQFNRAKIYSGLYEIQGRSCPFIVVVKCGAEGEVSRPGNRGKRDSQIILMRYLSRVHFDSEMCPLELELYHQMKNIIGIHPSFFEYCLFVDSDTEVYPDSLNRLISCMVNDSKIVGLCGETLLANERGSWVTSLQVYEYFISHHLSKAFESMFGSVTCLPGCFSMYRIRTPTKNVPLLISPTVINEYSENKIDTLHKKNLFLLGEDRYLTTLILKHFPGWKLSFTNDAKCSTYAPDTWSVFLSQRRRWINSTVHNLLELLTVKELCGVCCLSMRFLVFLDLISTFLQPAAIVYIIYLIVTLIADPELGTPMITLILLAAVYGLQVILFIFKQEFAHIGWMVVYLLASPLFAYLDLYAWWHFDDFSWGSTRVVMGEGKKFVYEKDVEEFDPSSVALRKFGDYESEILLYNSGAAASEMPVKSVYAPSHVSKEFLMAPTSYVGSTYTGIPPTSSVYY
ncbi:chitin synthase [Synchytrium endobioticum]|uniref:chitin synthase n=1 Tax=Synchytrium endobioticum TaxID=286115 RepID=A0A507D518_9FUNG|nr:chitin synthase [Synchytrium endobioticum]TPX46809.1 chitin synthase [Synchytrium endobioticum]